MTTTHVGWGGLGAFVGAVVSYLFRRYAGMDVTTENGAAVGTGIGVAIGHMAAGPGIFPAIKRAFFGAALSPEGPVDG